MLNALGKVAVVIGSIDAVAKSPSIASSIRFLEEVEWKIGKAVFGW